MKKYIGILLVICGTVFSTQAQEKPVDYVKEGDLVKATFYHENGAIAQVGYYLDGKLHGEWNMFDDQGKKLAIGQYAFGQKSGKWFFWNKTELKEVDYLKNQVVNVTLWDNREAIVSNK